MDLYLIGNGFDINEGLKTKYDDFYRYLQESNNDLIDGLRLFYNSIFFNEKVENGIIDLDKTVLIEGDQASYPPNEYLWGSLERNLANISYSSIINEFGLYKFPIENCKELIQEISDEYEIVLTILNRELTKWILGIETNTLFKKRFKSNNKFVSFNYTSTLEDRYSVEEKDICYIHGLAKKDDLIFGCSKKDLDSFKKYSFDYIRESSLGKELKLILSKKFKCTNDIIKHKLKPFLSEMNFKRIIVLGLSFSMVDIPYLSYIQKLFPKSNWIVSFRKDSKEKINQFAKDHGLDYTLINDIDLFLLNETD